ncbi:MAG: class I SAM-dependent methyltransferase, partial [Elusimicrobia bacterium]|nr:class I SAM-dependent methyltransferase [Elusimicrobiota bacterium]
CGTYQTHPFPQNTAAFYQESYYSRQKSRRFAPVLEWGIRWFRTERAWNISRRYPRGRILDVGCGRGLMLHFLQRRFGWTVQGTQISRTAHAYATEVLGVPVFLGDVRLLPNEAPFTLVTMFHVLEHLVDPGAYLDDAHRRLVPGGGILIEVPNTAGLMARLTKGRWFGWDVPYHTFHFSPEAVTRTLERHGFSVEEIQHWSGEFNTYIVLQSMLNLVFKERNYLFRLLQRKARLRRRPVAAPLCLVLGALLFPAALAIAAVGAMAGRGEVIRVYARKKSV